jgi:hypothetical protein
MEYYIDNQGGIEGNEENPVDIFEVVDLVSISKILRACLCR